jgi:hypothetical protein
MRMRRTALDHMRSPIFIAMLLTPQLRATKARIR